MWPVLKLYWRQISEFSFGDNVKMVEETGKFCELIPIFIVLVLLVGWGKLTFVKLQNKIF